MYDNIICIVFLICLLFRYKCNRQTYDNIDTIWIGLVAPERLFSTDFFLPINKDVEVVFFIALVLYN